jgi:hypothetical protein
VRLLLPQPTPVTARANATTNHCRRSDMATMLVTIPQSR